MTAKGLSGGTRLVFIYASFRPRVRSRVSISPKPNNVSASLQNTQAVAGALGGGGMASPLFEFSICALAVLQGLFAGGEALIPGPFN
jgi:hypothetical protein